MGIKPHRGFESRPLRSRKAPQIVGLSAAARGSGEEQERPMAAHWQRERDSRRAERAGEGRSAPAAPGDESPGAVRRVAPGPAASSTRQPSAADRFSASILQRSIAGSRPVSPRPVGSSGRAARPCREEFEQPRSMIEGRRRRHCSMACWNNRREVGPLEAVAPGPVQAVVFNHYE
jgi:hypothetical protein